MQIYKFRLKSIKFDLIWEIKGGDLNIFKDNNSQNLPLSLSFDFEMKNTIMKIKQSKDMKKGTEISSKKSANAGLYLISTTFLAQWKWQRQYLTL